METKGKKPLYNYARYSALAFHMGIIIFAGAYGGVKLDAYLKSAKLVSHDFPTFTFTFAILSVILAIYFGIKDLIKINKP